MIEEHPVALVTGGTRGIGFGIAQALAREGWDLAVCGVRAAAAVTPALDSLRSHGRRVHYVEGDLASPPVRARLVVEVRRELGRLTALVNNAGKAPAVRADLLEATEASFEDVLRTNLQAPYFLTQAIAREMIDTGTDDSRRAIVFISSVSAEMASLSRGEYCVSKAGLAMAAKLFAVRLAPHRIPVYEVRPGIIATDMSAGVKAAYDARIANGLVPDARWGTPEDVGRTVAALLRGDLPFATGSVVHVDGGLAIPRL